MSMQTSPGGIAVRSSSDSSCDRRSEIVASASAMGTLVKRLTTSKLTMVSLLWMVVCLIWFAKSVEFLMKELVLPARGERILASFLARRYVGEPMALTMGLRGIPSL